MPKRRGCPRKERTPGIWEYLTEVRESQGKTQQEIGLIIGKSRSCICKIERGTRTQKSLHGILLYDLARAYGAPIAEILEESNWTQLPLLDTTEEERQQLIRHLKRIRRQKHE